MNHQGDFIPPAKPIIGDEERVAVDRVLRSGMLAQGPEVKAFEEEMDAAGADWQFVDFSGAVHCFAEPSAGSDPASNCRYDERAAKRGYRMMDGFFDEVFGAD